MLAQALKVRIPYYEAGHRFCIGGGGKNGGWEGYLTLSLSDDSLLQMAPDLFSAFSPPQMKAASHVLATKYPSALHLCCLKFGNTWQSAIPL